MLPFNYIYLSCMKSCMALFTARAKRAGTKGATPSAVQYIPHAEQGLVLEPWAKSTAPLVLSDEGKREAGGGRFALLTGAFTACDFFYSKLHLSCCEPG